MKETALSKAGKLLDQIIALSDEHDFTLDDVREYED